MSRFDELLLRWSDGTLSPEQYEELLGLLKDASNRAKLVEELYFQDSVAEIFRESQSNTRTYGANRLKLTSLRPRRRENSNNYRIPLSIAAAAILVATVAIHFYTKAPIDQTRANTTAAVVEVRGKVTKESGASASPVEKGQFLTPGESVLTESGAEVKIRYPDDSEVVIGNGTEISLIDQPQNPQKQLLIKKGVIDAAVAKQPVDRPFKIETPFASITVIGTRFNVNVSAASTQLKVTEGTVRLARNNGAESVVVSNGSAVATASTVSLVEEKDKSSANVRVIDDLESGNAWTIGENANGQPIIFSCAAEAARRGKFGLMLDYSNSESGKSHFGYVTRSLKVKSSDQTLRFYLRVFQCDANAELFVHLLQNDAHNWNVKEVRLSKNLTGWALVEIALPRSGDKPSLAWGGKDGIFSHEKIERIAIGVQYGSAKIALDDFEILPVDQIKKN